MAICRKFLAGSCDNGSACSLEHIKFSKQDVTTTSPPDDQGSSYNGIHSEVSYQIDGMKVIFGAGAKVKHWTDFSAIQDSAGIVKQISRSVVRFSMSRPLHHVVLEYATEEMVRKAARIFWDLVEGGQTVHCDVQSKDEHPGARTHKLRLTNLDPSATLDHLVAYSAYHGCSVISSSRDQNDSVDHKNGISSLKSLIAREGVEEWSYFAQTEHSQDIGSVLAIFAHQQQATEMVKALDGRQIPELDFATLHAAIVLSLKFAVPAQIFIACQRQIECIQKRINSSLWRPFWVGISSKDGDYTIQLFGDSRTAMKMELAQLQSILTGSIILDGAKAMWHYFFEDPHGQIYLQDLTKMLGGSFTVDPKARVLRAYGTFLQRGSLQATLTKKLHEMSLFKLEMPLSISPWEFINTGKMARLQQAFGKDSVYMKQDRQPNVLEIRGNPEELERITKLLASAEDLTGDQSTKGATKNSLVVKLNIPSFLANPCSVCFSKAVEPIVTSCNHTYCLECFRISCMFSPQNVGAVRCFGDAGLCGVELELAEIHRHLGQVDFEKMLENSFRTFVRRSPKEIQYCPTPDCHAVYRVHSKGCVWTCAECLTDVCTSCRTVYHQNKTCKQYRKDLAKQDDGLATWKATNDARTCPICDISIEKTVGCLHIQCAACNTHFCWACTKSFPTAVDTYDHVKLAHYTSQVEADLEALQIEAPGDDGDDGPGQQAAN